MVKRQSPLLLLQRLKNSGAVGIGYQVTEGCVVAGFVLFLCTD